jgi:hypothetical protein
MNANALAKHYDRLTPEERFRLILAAGARGDHAEQDRLVNAGQRITLSMSDHSPYAHAFDECALLIFIELLEGAAFYSDRLDHADDVCSLFPDEDNEGEDGGEGAAEDEVPADQDRRRSDGQWALDLALAAGFVLRTKAEGWKRFCERMNVPALADWEGLPGFDRLQRGLALAQKAAFDPEGFLRWWNGIRPADEPERTEVPMTVEGMADAAERLFRDRVQWWGGWPTPASCTMAPPCRRGRSTRSSPSPRP